MEDNGSPIHRVLIVLLFLCAAAVAFIGYGQFQATRPGSNLEVTTWLPKTKIVHLMRYHGTDGLKITQDEVYIWRNSKWIPVMKRNRG
jgi:hypothetical protein